MSVDESVRQYVRQRANNRCEYCHLSQDVGAVFRFHIEHVRPRQHGGDDNLENLALACPNCNWAKGPNLSAIDPVDDIMVPLFNPRKDAWQEHFVLVDLHIEDRTPRGRATVGLLRLNAADRLEIREQLAPHGKLDRRK